MLLQQEVDSGEEWIGDRVSAAEDDSNLGEAFVSSVQSDAVVSSGSRQRASGVQPTDAVPGFAAQRHVRVLGASFLACGFIRLALVVLALSIWADKSPPGVRRWATIRLVLLPVTAATGLLGLVAGAGLLAERPWARRLALIPAALNLPVVPFGTALGVYAFLALRKKEVTALLRSSG